MRAADVAAGGQGAPLVPVYHRALAAAVKERPVAFVNIGGVANMTWIGRDGALVAFDTGPGNALLNDWCERHTDVPYDKDGMLGGTRQEQRKRARTATEKQLFRNCQRPNLSTATASMQALWMRCRPPTVPPRSPVSPPKPIAISVKLVPEAPRLYVICGGGRLNPTLIQDLRQLLQAPVIVAEDAGMNGDSMEAEAWAYLAVRCLKGLPITFPGTTGAPRPLPGGVMARP